MSARLSRAMDDAVARAVAQALKSTETFRHGAVMLDGRSVVAVGRNRNINSCGLSSIHAEMDAAWKAARRRSRHKHLHVVVVRLRRDTCGGGGGGMGFSRPCQSCSRALAKMGVRRVTYSTGDPRAPLATEAITRSNPKTQTTTAPSRSLEWPASTAQIWYTQSCSSST
jgi:tRNA(Arg) A34 adenosine deaminase TadA